MTSTSGSSVISVQTMTRKSVGQNCCYVNYKSIYVLAFGSGGPGCEIISPTGQLEGYSPCLVDTRQHL
jgi:hypothetical protein